MPPARSSARFRSIRGGASIRGSTNTMTDTAARVGSAVSRLRDGKPVRAPGAREKLAAAWETELAYYRSAPLVFDTEAHKGEFFEQAERALAVLRDQR